MGPTNNNAVEKQEFRRKTTLHRKKRMSRMSITAKQAKKLQIETNDKEELTTGKIRKLSRISRSNSKMKKTAQFEMNDEAQNEARKKALELESLVWNDNLSDKTNFSEVYSAEDEEVDSLREEEEQNESINWIQDGELENCPINYIEDDERKFWKYIIKEHLYPLNEDKEKQKKIKDELKELRNKATGAYYFANALWLVLNFALH